MVIYDHPFVGCKDALQILKYFSFIINVFYTMYRCYLVCISVVLCFTFLMVLYTTWFLILPPLDKTLTLPVGFAANI